MDRCRQFRGKGAVTTAVTRRQPLISTVYDWTDKQQVIEHVAYTLVQRYTTKTFS